jgi:sarcosine oxidase gamma subunit
VSEPSAPVEPLKHTSLHAIHESLGARLVPFAGWSMPVQYEGLVKEHQAVRERCGLFDVSHMGELELEGPGAVALVDSLVTNAISTLPVGRAAYTVCCNAQGTILDDLIIYRRGESKILVVCNASNRDKIAAHFGKHAAGKDLSYRDASDETALLAIQGPRAVDVVRDAGAPSLGDLASFALGEATIGGVKVLAARTGYTGEDGFELFCAWDDAPALWTALTKAGEKHGPRSAALALRQRDRRDHEPARGGARLGGEARPRRLRGARRVARDPGEGPDAKAGRHRHHRPRHRAPRLSDRGGRGHAGPDAGRAPRRGDERIAFADHRAQRGPRLRADGSHEGRHPDRGRDSRKDHRGRGREDTVLQTPEGVND